MIKEKDAVLTEITAGWLDDRHACGEGISIFRSEWGESAPLTRANLMRAAELGLDIDWLAEAILNKDSRAEYERVRAQAWADCDRVTAPALEEYERVRAQAWAEGSRVTVTAPALEEYERVTAQAWADCDRVRALAWAEGSRVTVTAPALEEYERVRAQAWAEYERVRALALVDILGLD